MPRGVDTIRIVCGFQPVQPPPHLSLQTHQFIGQALPLPGLAPPKALSKIRHSGFGEMLNPCGDDLVQRMRAG